MSTRTAAALALTAFMITLAIVVGQRLSSEAMAVLLGVLAGVTASIPTSLIVVWVALSRWGRRPERTAPAREPDEAPLHGHPPYVVVQPPPTALPHPGDRAPAGYNGYGYPAQAPFPTGVPYQYGQYGPQFGPQAHPQREFTVIGGESLE